MNHKAIHLIVLLGTALFGVSIAHGKSRQLTGTLVEGLRLVDLATGKERRVRAMDPSCITDRSRMSPNGRWIAVLCQASTPGGKDGAIRIMDSDGRNERVLLEPIGGVQFAWSPDSRFLALTTGNLDQGIRIWEVDKKRSWTLPIRIEGAYSLGASIFKWLADGRGFMAIVNLDESNVQFGIYKIELGNPIRFELLYRDNTPGEFSIAPDETRLGFVPLSLTSLWVRSLGDEKWTQVHQGRNSLMSILWSPDGQWIGARQNRPNRSEPGTWTVWNLATKRSINLPVHNAVFDLQWWAPQTTTPPDCEKIIREALGPGEPLHR